MLCCMRMDNGLGDARANESPRERARTGVWGRTVLVPFWCVVGDGRCARRVCTTVCAIVSARRGIVGQCSRVLVLGVAVAMLWRSSTRGRAHMGHDMGSGALKPYFCGVWSETAHM